MSHLHTRSDPDLCRVSLSRRDKGLILNSMKYKLPPLNALKVFESAARNLSFTKAAEELFITQGAVSKQIKILEEYLGFPLFKRVYKGLTLTKKAEEYYQNIYPALDSIRISTHLIGKKHAKNNILSIDTLPSLSSYWLIPRLQSFKEKNPDIELNIVGGSGEIDFSRTKADVAIRSSDKEIKELESIKLMDEEMLMIANSSIAKKIKTIKDIAKFNILDHSDRPNDLKNWMNLVGLKNVNPQNKIKFEHFFMVIEAAKQGLGVGFVPSFMLSSLLKSGELVNVLNIKHKTNFSYFLLYPKENMGSSKIKVFHNWLLNIANNKS